MIYRYASIKRVIAKVFTDLDLQEGDHRISDLIEWGAEALEKIGSFPQMETKVTGKDGYPLIELANYQASLPSDFHRLVQLAYSNSKSGPFYPMRTVTGSMDYGNELTDSTNLDAENVADSEIVILVQELYDYTYEQALDFVNNYPQKASQLSYLLDEKRTTDNRGATTTTTDYVYHINDSYVKTNVETGYLMMSYQAVPTDAEGYPLVPDDQSFIEAIYWYITMKVLYPKWASGQIRDAVYYDARRSWNYYCKQAYGNALMPDLDKMETIKNVWLKLVPSINDHSSFYSATGEQEIVWDHNKS